ncbi:hypothetical protein RchiOBHm_Chr6g0259081 [Rosa chinensis]|uniref:Uncharacterized protein n=1 Tax=Rosa chinensis TaxID=74649 RepID=A0A2P6PMT4_ROSCH|nr:hypothetical protein RchiOBHm_Chr6g0259081 [Rosa chinensis]
MKRNLISVSCLVKKRCTFFIDLSGIKVSFGSKSLAFAPFINDYWLLDCSLPKDVMLIKMVNQI